MQSVSDQTVHVVNLNGRNFAKEHEKKADECWQHSFWSDETKIN